LTYSGTNSNKHSTRTRTPLRPALHSYQHFTRTRTPLVPVLHTGTHSTRTRTPLGPALHSYQNFTRTSTSLGHALRSYQNSTAKSTTLVPVLHLNSLAVTRTRITGACLSVLGRTIKRTRHYDPLRRDLLIHWSRNVSSQPTLYPVLWGNVTAEMPLLRHSRGAGHTQYG
jgi:hypothetical protein